MSSNSHFSPRADPDATFNGTNIHYDFFDPARSIPQAMTAFTAIAWFSSAETLILIFIYFKKYQGLYFWSILLATTAVLPYATGKCYLCSQTPRARELTIFQAHG